MKGITAFIAILCIAVCLLGWLSFAIDNATASNELKNNREQADAWVEEGLYQRAIKLYQEARTTQSDDLELGRKIADAYALRYAEVAEETHDDYVDTLEDLLGDFPGDEEFTIALANIYFEDENYTQAYTYLKTAVDMGSKSVEIEEMYLRARYAFSLGVANYNDVKEFTGTAYTVARNGKWGILDIENGLIHTCDYIYAGQTNKDGVYLFTDEKDSRLIDGAGMILGIFEEKIVDAGVYADGLIAASDGETYHYYDEFAKKVIGGYEIAGTFCDGRAAVKKDGKWILIDKSGESVSDSFAHIVLTAAGEYISNERIIAASSEGNYKIYNEKFKEVASLAFDEVDVLSEDGLIAVAKGGKWGFINTDGEVVIEPQYEKAGSFSNGLAAVCKDGKWGFINQDNEVVIPCQFTEVTRFNVNGSCMVRVDVPETEAETDVMENNEENLQEETTEQAASQETTETVVDGTIGDAVTIPEEAVPQTETYQEEWKMLKLYNSVVEE